MSFLHLHMCESKGGLGWEAHCSAVTATELMEGAPCLPHSRSFCSTQPKQKLSLKSKESFCTVISDQASPTQHQTSALFTSSAWDGWEQREGGGFQRSRRSGEAKY